MQRVSRGSCDFRGLAFCVHRTDRSAGPMHTGCFHFSRLVRKQIKPKGGWERGAHTLRHSSISTTSSGPSESLLLRSPTTTRRPRVGRRCNAGDPRDDTPGTTALTRTERAARALAEPGVARATGRTAEAARPTAAAPTMVILVRVGKASTAR